jgi:hypothetical protein
MSLWNRLFGPKQASSDEWVVRYKGGTRFVYISLNKDSSDADGAVVTDPSNADTHVEVFQKTFAFFLRVNPQGARDSGSIQDFLEKMSQGKQAELMAELTVDLARMSAEQFREKKIATETQLTTAEAVPLAQAIKDHNNGR